MRKLHTAYTGSAIRVRRSIIPSGQPSEQDIGFNVNGNLDTVSLLAFCGVGDGFVTTWYDQSGNAKNATQATAANQPQIVSSGTVELLNSLPTIKFDGSDDYLESNEVFTSSINLTSFVITQSANVTINQYLYDNSNTVSYGGGYSLRFLSSGGFRLWSQDARTNVSGGSTTNNTPVIVSQLSQLTSGTIENNEMFVNNTSVGTNSGIPGSRNAKTTTRIGNSELLSGFINGKISEIIAYDSYKSSDRAGITTEINIFYNIYI